MLTENVKGYLSVKTVDTAISCLGPKGSNVLTWRKLEPPKPAEPKPVELLPNGETRLPLGTIPSNSHSITQLRDLDAVKQQ